MATAGAARRVANLRNPIGFLVFLIAGSLFDVEE
jgi:hypothetical protein